SEQNRGLADHILQKRHYIGGIAFAGIATLHVTGFAVTAEVDRVHMPLLREMRNQDRKILAVPRQPVQQHQRRAVFRPFLVVQHHRARMKLVVRELVYRSQVGPSIHFPSSEVAFQTVFPPTMVRSTLTSRILVGSMLKISSLNRTISASLPTVIDPLSVS